MIVCAAVSTQAQSGRRAKEKQTTVPVQPTETEKEKPAPATKPEARPISLIVAIDEDMSGASVSLGNSQLVMRGFVERMKRNSAVSLKVESRMDRKEASDLAKSEKGAYVVWLQLDRRMIASSRQDNEIYVVYVVFPPGTGKSKKEGSIYVNYSRQGRIGIGNIPIGVPLPPTGTGSTRLDDALLDAGREAAERVMPELEVMDGSK